MSGRKKDLRVAQGKKPLSHGWIVLPSKTYPDRVYFYNTVTKCSTWNNPCEDTNDQGCNDSSSETSSTEVNYSVKTKPKSLRVTHPKRHSSAIILHQLDKNFNNKINHEIEDYDDQDKYFDEVPRNLHSLSHSHIISPPSSPETDSSTKTNITDLDKHDNTLLENKKNQLWIHFVSSPEKPNWKKSVALSDLQEPCTSQNLEIEKTNESEGNKLIFTKDNGFFDSSTCDGLKLSRKKNNWEKKSVLSKKMESSVFKIRYKTPAQTRLLKLRKENAEKLTKLSTNYLYEAVSSEGNSRNVIDVNVVDSSDLIRKKLKKKKKRKRSASVSSSIGDEFPKNVDKTPAQTKLLNLRKQNTDRVQKLAARHPELAIPSAGNSVVQNPVVFDSGTCSKSVPEYGNNSFEDYTEEMDWEPSCEEWDVRDINEFRQQLVKASEISNNIFFNSDPSFTLPTKTHCLCLVPDTNIFVSCLNFIKELRDTKVPDLGYPVIYVPWRVLQELDHLKDSKIRTTSKNLKGNVRKAISYLNDNFKLRHPRIFGQSFEDFVKMVDFESYAPDDEILQTCMQLHKQHTDKRLILLTNDKNLESKAIVSNVEVYSKVGFWEKFLKLGLPLTVEGGLKVSSNGGVTSDYCLCEAKSLLRDFLSAVVETEMKIAFEGEWLRLVVKKPPWSLKDAMECLLKHWMSVFFLKFSKDTQFEAKLLYEKLFNKEPVTNDEVADVIRTCQRLVKSIEKSQNEKRPYLNLIPVTLTKLSELLSSLSPNHPQVDVGELPSMSSTNPPVHDSFAQSHVNQSAMNDVSRVKSLFKDIWDSLRNFCCSISDIIQSIGSNNDVAIQEMRLKIGQTLNEVEEFVSTAEKILELNPVELNECHPVIVYFSSFLIHVYPNILPELKKELPKCMAAFFTDFEGRSLLSSSLGDFKEFVQDLAKASEYFNAQTSC